MDKTPWQLFALGSAFFAGLTAILGKVGVEGINSNLATFIRTVVILASPRYSSPRGASGSRSTSSRAARSSS